MGLLLLTASQAIMKVGTYVLIYTAYYSNKIEFLRVEAFDSINKNRTFLKHLSEYRLLRKDSAPFRYLRIISAVHPNAFFHLSFPEATT